MFKQGNQENYRRQCNSVEEIEYHIIEVVKFDVNENVNPIQE